MSDVFIVMNSCMNWNRGGKMPGGERNGRCKNMEVERPVSGMGGSFGSI